MTTFSLTMTEEHSMAIKSHLLDLGGTENVAYLVCNPVNIGRDPWDGGAHEKYLVSRVVPVTKDDIIENSPVHVTWRTSSLVRLLKEAEAEGSVVGIIHNHPAGMTGFSEQDDANEPDLMQLIVNRSGASSKFLSLVLTADGMLSGRVWLSPRKVGCVDLRLIRVIGESIALHYPGRGAGQSPAALQRQALALGHALNADLRTLRIGVVGCGGTGSATALLLARLGVGQVVCPTSAPIGQNA